MVRTVRIQEDASSPSDEDDSPLTSPSSDKENARTARKSIAATASRTNAKGKGAANGKGKGKEVARRRGGGLAEIGEQNARLEEEVSGEESEEGGSEEDQGEDGEEEEGEEEVEEDGEEQNGEGEEEEEEEEVEQEDTDMYDPDQDPEERRQMRMQYRELSRKLNDNKNEYLQPHSDGIRRTFEQAEQLFKKVKQTSDATIDSRLLVQATDLALKKATNLTYGNSGATIDADEFVGQCIAFMRSNTHPRRPDAPDEDDDAAADDAMDWAYLGRMAAFKGNKRPPTTDFLLGPLSVTKKIRIMKARRQGLRRDNANLVRPVEVTQEPGEKAESGSSAMSALVQKIYLDLKAWFRRNPARTEKGLNLFRFVVNPNSFGQTVENMFYLSFLVKDGFIAISYDEENGLPVIHCTDPATQEDHKEFDITRNQVIFSITMWEWQEMKSIFDITESMIPTRAQEQVLTSATGWYS